MGLFSPKVPNTISDKKMASLQRRGRAADKESMFSKRNVDRRKADAKQRGKSKWS
jgi:hypothetical protein